jgi:hypothetical protein
MLQNLGGKIMGEGLNLKELQLMIHGLKAALRRSKEKNRFTALEGMYSERRVAEKLVENGRNVQFFYPQFDLLIK